MSQLTLPSKYDQSSANYFVGSPTPIRYPFFDSLSEGTTYIVRNYCDESVTNANDYYVDDSSRNNLASALDKPKVIDPPEEVTRLIIGDLTGSGVLDLRLKWLFVRTWTGNDEPTHSSWGTEESSSTTTPTDSPTTGTPPPPPPDNFMIVILGIGGGGIAIIAIIVIFLKRTPSGGGSPETGYSW